MDSNIFEFVFENESWGEVLDKIPDRNFAFVKTTDIHKQDYFWTYIDYYFSPSYAEGGPMDVLNAAKCGIPIISRPIGFFPELKTANDIVFEDYNDLLYQLREKLECPRISRIELMKRHTWDNFKNWHIELFKEII